MLPNVACLCPTYRHPQLLANALACFLAQDYPADRRRLLILDDAGQIDPQVGPNWAIRSTANRSPSLPHKYAALCKWSDDLTDDAGRPWVPHVYAVWDDDDIYLPNHLSAAVAGLVTTPGGWVAPERIWSLYTGRLEQEDATGRFHGSTVISRASLTRVGGWLGVMPNRQAGRIERLDYPDELQAGDRRADFDQRMLCALGTLYGPHPPARPLAASPTYVYRWGTTHSPHCSGLMRTPDDETWYQVYPSQFAGPPAPVSAIRPSFDAETLSVFSQLEQKINGSPR